MVISKFLQPESAEEHWVPGLHPFPNIPNKDTTFLERNTEILIATYFGQNHLQLLHLNMFLVP
jgi:hypothetical protein